MDRIELSVPAKSGVTEIILEKVLLYQVRVHKKYIPLVVKIIIESTSVNCIVIGSQKPVESFISELLQRPSINLEQPFKIIIVPLFTKNQ